MEEEIKYYLIVEDGRIIGKTTNPDDNDIEVSETVFKEYERDAAKYIYRNGQIIENPDYADIIVERRRQQQREYLLSEIEELDKKRIRAVCEPSIKDEITGQTWLEYYNAQIENLRNQLNKLN